MSRFILVSLVAGLLMAFLDGLIHANPYAVRLYEVYKPISRSSVNAPLGLAIDFTYGFVMAALFLLLYPSLPGQSALLKGISFALIAWFFRVLMSVLGEFMTRTTPPTTLLYILLTGMAQMLLLGTLYATSLRPRA